LGQLKAHLSLTQSKVAQLPSVHGVHPGGGVLQSIAVRHFCWPQAGAPGWHLPASLQKLITDALQSPLTHGVQS